MYAVPGGLIGVGMKVDPFITRSDSLVGQIIGHPGLMPEVLSEIDVNYFLLKRLLGVKNQEKIFSRRSFLPSGCLPDGLS